MAKRGAARSGKAQRKGIRRVEPRASGLATVEPAVEVVEPRVEAAVARPAAPASYSAIRSTSPTLRRAAQAPVAVPSDYAYVRQDLKRIGVLVGVITVVLVALTFVLR